jgi:hypothetical protein
MLGDVITETFARIAAGVFDGNADALFAAIVDRQLDEFVREALLGTATFLAQIRRRTAGRAETYGQRA